jgi:hypothetical protein
LNEALKKTDSLDMPLASGDDAFLTVAAGSPVTSASHTPKRSASSSGEREVLTTTMSSVSGGCSSGMVER